MKLIVQDSWAKERKIFHKTSPPFSGLDFTWERQKGSEDAPINPFQMVIIRLTSGWVLKYLWSHLKTSKCTQCTLGIIDINQFYGAISSYISGRSWINLSRFPFDSLSKFFSNVIEYETPKVHAFTYISSTVLGRQLCFCGKLYGFLFECCDLSVATNLGLLVAMSLPWQLLQENPDCIFAY